MFLERQAWMSHASFLHGSLLGCGIPSPFSSNYSAASSAAAGAARNKKTPRYLCHTHTRATVPVQEERCFAKRRVVSRVPNVKNFF
jgi:hypothetical protein